MKRALISVTDKTGIVEFARSLSELGYEIISTGGTLNEISKNGIAVTPIDKITNFPEILDGRVKTLHPMVHGGLLYKRDNPRHVETASKHGISPIDIVVVNLYDFEGSLKLNKAHEEMIENIDIGGPSMIRSAAKNYKDVLVVVEPNDYDKITDMLKNEKITLELREELAMKAYSATAYYDAMISRYFMSKTGKESDSVTLGFKKVEELRYGENPHQAAKLYNDNFVNSYFSNYNQLNGKNLSFNNLNDLNTAVELCAEFDSSKGDFAAVALKHATPCGVALGNTPFEAFKKAYDADKLSIFGGIVAMNSIVDADTAALMSEIFLEVVAAPSYTEDALEILKKKKNLRILEIDVKLKKSEFDIKYLSGKVLIQDTDNIKDEKFECVTLKKTTKEEDKDLIFAMKVCKYVKSNAVVIAKDLATRAIGGGQTSRIWALDTAINNYSDKNFSGCVLASDAFFPFSDCVELAAEIGITSIIQPGGSVKDQMSIDECNKSGVSMIFTGTRHFKH
ncbi:bifunctional phosphoribosylaminoimidazolecarboxamide formyltransferase/IMP cyclohydrolase [Proteocatella sphenisci]|uniref:bifunctional phosphoribosylaminoimidazolecarboxamide formyltransferase/IMP cyclohydrolase n=1 Tax=Proteocatella sphenisci TaxID=181070 RepID=UPI0004904793|nr:bifunctional phosphoribosylaminoimidazolecarboxamide formyltransferase/IMP cyclohydrolase [Proteocatella sphenisci]